MNNGEREQRLKEIRERRSRNTGPSFGYTAELCADIDFLLSLLDSQAADGDLSHCALCEDPNFIYRDCALAAATRMRERCVARVKQLLPEYEKLDHAPPSNALREVITALESLTLNEKDETTNAQP